MISIINLTPHDIYVANQAGEIIQRFRRSGNVARIKDVQVKNDDFTRDFFYPIFRNIEGKVENLPPPRLGVVYLVSLAVLNKCALSGRLDLLAPDTGASCIRDEEGRIVAVRQFLSN